jgi:hypothetical protein
MNFNPALLILFGSSSGRIRVPSINDLAQWRSSIRAWV